jgi:hypothetical protein
MYHSLHYHLTANFYHMHRHCCPSPQSCGLPSRGCPSASSRRALVRCTGWSERCSKATT